MREKADRYKVGKYDDNSLWLADDATIIARDEESLLKALNILQEVGRKNGLELSKEKTKILRVTGNGTEEKIGGFSVVKEVK